MLSKFSFFHRFLNLMTFSSDLLFSTGWFLASSRFRKMQNFQIFRGLCPFYPHQGSALDPLGAYSTPDPQLQKTMTLGHCLSCLWHDKTQLKIPLQLPKGHKNVSVLICSLQNVFGQFTNPGTFSSLPGVKSVLPGEFLHIYPEIFAGPPGVLQRGVRGRLVTLLRRGSWEV